MIKDVKDYMHVWRSANGKEYYCMSKEEFERYKADFEPITFLPTDSIVDVANKLSTMVAYGDCYMCKEYFAKENAYNNDVLLKGVVVIGTTHKTYIRTTENVSKSFISISKLARCKSIVVDIKR